ncbi:MAG: flippase-like domain-containing protein [Myxococcales bacterium]|nr:flippase-like domain-containing protein [Myxococcales bacterium]
MKRETRRWLILGIGAAISGALLFLSLRKIEFSELAQHIGKVTLPILALGLVARFSNFCLVAARSAFLFAPLHRYPFWVLFKSALLANAVNNVVPFRAGDVARIGYLSREGKLPASSCLAVVAVERLLDLMAVSVVIVCTLPAMAIDMPLGTPFYIAAAGMLTFVGGAIWASRRPELFVALLARVAGVFGKAVKAFVEGKSKTFADGLSALSSPVTVLAVTAISLLFWTLATVGVQIWIWAFGFDLPWYTPVVVLTFLTFGLAVPSTPGHIGSFHFFAAAAMMAVGLPEAESVSFAVVGHAMAVVPFTLLALPVLFRDFAKRERAEGTQEQETP